MNITDATTGMDDGFFDSDWILPMGEACEEAPPVQYASAPQNDIDIDIDMFDADEVSLEEAGSITPPSPEAPIVSESFAPEPTVAPEPPRSDFPEVLFYDVVRVSSARDVVIPVADTLGTFAVEAFTLVDGDWNDA